MSQLQPTPPAQPQPVSTPVVAFAANPAIIAFGASSTLQWSAINATSVSISPNVGSGTLPLTGSAIVTPAVTTTYTLTATGAGGTATQSVTITVAQPVAPTVSLTADHASIAPGQLSTITWSTTNATSLTISPNIQKADDKGPLPLSGSTTVSPAATTSYTATAVGPGGTVTATVPITVTAMQLNLSAKPDTIALGQSAILSWTTIGITSLKIDNGVGDVSTKLPAGAVTVSPISSTTYTATASGPGGTITQKVVVSVSAPKPVGPNPIKHIIFMLQENRSFDNYFGRLGAYRAAHISGATPAEVDGFDPNVVLKNASGVAAKPYHQKTVCTENLSPSWNESHYDTNLQAPSTFLDTDFSKATFLMDRFMQTTGSTEQLFDPNGTRTLGFYDERDLPYYYELATQFATSDRFYSSLLAGTIPNRMYMFTGTSFGHVKGDIVPKGGWTQKTIFRAMNDAGVSWRYYYQDAGVYLSDFADWNDDKIQAKVKNISDWFTLLASPTADQDLPQVVFIERTGLTGLDEHPENNIQTGAATVQGIINALMKSTAWSSSVFILTYDEGGGLYDHVPPFQVPPPDNIAPLLSPPSAPGDNFPGRFNLSGFRLPVLVLSPWVKPHFVSHKPRELTSILKLIESLNAVPPLTQRDAQADDMTEFFDFSKPALLTPPPLPAQLTNGVCDKSIEAGPTF